MGTILKRDGKSGPRYTARVRLAGAARTKTFGTKSAAEGWIRAQEGAIETGTFKATDPDAGKLFAEAVDFLIERRVAVRRPPGATFRHTLERFKSELGLTPLLSMNDRFWANYAFRRMTKDGVQSQTAATDLLYASTVLRHAKRNRWNVDAEAPAIARQQLSDDGLRVVSRQRERRITDDELDSLLVACDAVQSHIPLGDIVRFALATAMRRGEILRMRWCDINGRVARVFNRKHPKDQERVDDVPLMKAHPVWPLCDPLEIINRQAKKRPVDRVFPYLGDSVGERFEHACADAGLDGVVFHLLRHEALSRYAVRGLDVMRLSKIGGHRDLRHLKRYVELTAAALAVEA